MSFRIGHGIDAHRFAKGIPLMLGGIQVPHDRGLEGHSDGDAVAHALADAILGAAGLGDVGKHFPSGEQKWKGATGTAILAEVRALITKAGFQLISAQVVIVAETPRLADHKPLMESALAQALGAELGTVTIGATTTDHMGFIGQEEGVAASAVALLASIP